MFNQNKIDELKSHLPDYVNRITEPSKGANMYVCPICHSGTGKNGTGAFKLYANGEKSSWYCYKCAKGGDIFDLIGEFEHIYGAGEQMRRAAELYGVQPDNNYTPKTTSKPKAVQPVANKEKTKEPVDYTEMFVAAHKRVNEKEPTEYLKKRGISAELIERFNIGYDGKWRHPEAQTAPFSPRIIVPTSKESYLARDVRPDNEQNKAYSKQKVGSVHFLNEEVLYTPDKQPVYLTEGEFNALSIIEVGGNAVALGSTSMVKKFLELMKREPPTRQLIIALDNDSGGDKATKELSKGLTDLYISYIVYRPQGKKYNDANDALVADRETFTKAVELGNDFENLKKEVREMNIEANNYKEHLQLSNGKHLQAFVDNVANSINDVCIPTGFSLLDKCLGDGLYPGLCMIGAVPSLGKTTFALQIADNAALSGTDVLIFSLEMSRFELISKSISRHTAMYLTENGGYAANAKSTREVSNGKYWRYFTDKDKELVEAAIRNYEKYADNVFVKEGVGDLSVIDIRKTVEEHIAATGKTPLVIVDYLQILAPHPDYVRSAERVIADKTTTELKRISRDFNTPVVVISSFNRQNYNQQVNFASFKESGGLEYGADILIGLQFDGVGNDKYSDTEAKSGKEYHIELVILKNRNGRTGRKIKYTFIPRGNYFFEDRGQKIDD